MNPQRAKGSFNAAVAILRRDMYVFCKEIGGNLLRIIGEPLFFLFVFGVLLPNLNLFQAGYIEILVPGIISMSTMTGSMRGVAAGIGLSFEYNEEIRAHILTPISMRTLALEKVICGTFQGIVSGTIVLALALVIFPGKFSFSPLFYFELLLIFIASGLTFASLGLALGSSFIPETMFEVLFIIMMPMMFFGATFYPLSLLPEVHPAFFYLTLFIPLTYISEGIRAILTPQIAFLPAIYCFIGIGVYFLIFFSLGVWAFKRRAIK